MAWVAVDVGGCAGWVCRSVGIQAGRDGVGVSRHGHGRVCGCECG